MLNHITARTIAKHLWGDVNGSYRTNRQGAFCFSCAGHGGYIVDGRTLSETELAQVTQFIDGYDALEASYHGKPRFMHPWRLKSMHYNAAQGTENFKIFLFEEDCDWAILWRFTGITSVGANNSGANECFWNWFDPENPEIQERKRQDEARANKDPNLIVSACRADYGQTLVTCADGRQHFLNTYDNTNPWMPAS